MPPLTVCSRIGAPPRPSLPCISRGFSVLSKVTGSSEKKFPLRQRVSRSACVSAGTASNKKTLGVSGVAPRFFFAFGRPQSHVPFFFVGLNAPPPSSTPHFPFSVSLPFT